MAFYDSYKKGKWKAAEEEIKLNFDGASQENPGPMKVGHVLWDAQGAFLLGDTCHLGQKTNNKA